MGNIISRTIFAGWLSADCYCPDKRIDGAEFARLRPLSHHFQYMQGRAAKPGQFLGGGDGAVSQDFWTTLLRDSSSLNRWSIIFLLPPPSNLARSLERTGPSLRWYSREPVHLPPISRTPFSMAQGSRRAFSTRILAAPSSVFLFSSSLLEYRYNRNETMGFSNRDMATVA